MKATCNILIVFALSCLAAPAEYINVLSEETARELPNTVTIDGVGPVYNASREVYQKAGWRRYEPCPSRRGSNITARVRTDDGWTVTEDCDYEAASEPPVSPAVIPEGIEVPWISILSSTGGVGWVFAVTDEGDLVPVVGHNSPWPDAKELRSRITNAVAVSKAERRRAEQAAGKGQIQDRIANIEQYLGISPSTPDDRR